MDTQALTCQELVELVTDYLEGALPAHERARFEAHLAGCQGCTAYVEQMRHTIRLTGRLREESLDPDARTALMALFRTWKQGRESAH
jgi:anti-sigma factor RsiW